jgi:hypothetical protein
VAGVLGLSGAAGSAGSAGAFGGAFGTSGGALGTSGDGAGGLSGTSGATGGGGTGGDAAGSAGSAGAGPFLPFCTPLIIPAIQPLITDFSVPGNSFGNYTDNISGDIFTFASITGDMSDGAWHVTGTVGDYSAMVLHLNCKYDASAFTGISFDIKGTFSPVPASGAGGTDAGGASGAGGSAGTGGHSGAAGHAGAGGTSSAGGSGGAINYGGVTTPQITFTVGTAQDDVDSAHSGNPPTWGTCVPVNNQYDGTCASPRKLIALSAIGGTQTFKWADLVGGKPRATPDPSQLTLISWTLPWNGKGPAYNVDITIDNVVFTTN